MYNLFFYLSVFQSKSTMDLYSFVRARRLVVVIDEFQIFCLIDFQCTHLYQQYSQRPEERNDVHAVYTRNMASMYDYCVSCVEAKSKVYKRQVNLQ